MESGFARSSFFLPTELQAEQIRRMSCPSPSLLELIHTATLVHDDINDEAQQRRGIPTIHANAGQAKAVIAGDWLFVQGFGLGGRYSAQIVSIIARCCANIAVSEFHQLDHVLNLATSPEDYLSIVRGKTAGPFASGCYMPPDWLRASKKNKPVVWNDLEWNSGSLSSWLTTCWTFVETIGWANRGAPTCTKEK